MTVKHMTRAAVAAMVIGLAACSANPPYNSTGSNAPSSGAVYYGHVESIETVPGTARSGPGIGAIGGAIVGGIAGNQVGQGRGNTAATVGGAIAGGMIGNEVEKRTAGAAVSAYRIRVRLDSGNIETYTQDTQSTLRVGDRVRVAEGRVAPY